MDIFVQRTLIYYVHNFIPATRLKVPYEHIIYLYEHTVDIFI